MLLVCWEVFRREPDQQQEEAAQHKSRGGGAEPESTCAELTALLGRSARRSSSCVTPQAGPRTNSRILQRCHIPLCHTLLPPPLASAEKSTLVSTQFERRGEFTSPLFEMRNSGRTKKPIKSELI